MTTSRLYTIGVIGAGVVGQAIARGFLEHAREVRVYDVLKERRTHTLADTLATSFCFICLPTPGMSSGKLDTSFIEKLCEEIEDCPTTLILKSTVPPGTTQYLSEKYRLPRLVHSPEFLTARCALSDFNTPARHVIGYVGRVQTHGRQVQLLYQARWPGIPCHVMTSTESELLKLLVNGYFASKIAWFNSARQLCEAVGAQWPIVLDGMLSDGRIAHSHTNVPGPDGKPGFGGECLPKDLGALAALAEENGVCQAVWEAAIRVNELARGKPAFEAAHAACEVKTRNGDNWSG